MRGLYVITNCHPDWFQLAGPCIYTMTGWEVLYTAVPVAIGDGPIGVASVDMSAEFLFIIFGSMERACYSSLEYPCGEFIIQL